MRVDVVAVGTELLLGQIVDTNSAYIGEQLAAHGFSSFAQTKVGDNLGRIVAALGRAVAEADAVIVCGGLGPTHDDLTREAIAEVMGVELVSNNDIAEHIRGLFAARNRPMAANNLRQALVPAGATAIPNDRGTAPGLICPVTVAGRECVLYAVPGVPHEMREMIGRVILPDLHARSGEEAVIVSRVLRTWGDSESRLNERLEGVIAELDGLGNPTLAFLASGWEGLKIRLTARADGDDGAVALLDQWTRRVAAVVGEHIFGFNDDTMESVVMQLLRERGLTLGVAESVTGGLVAGRVTNIAGSSEVFRGGVVAYASEVKFDLLGVAPGPVVSEATAGQMADGVRRVVGSSVGLALTGVAGPTEQDGMPVGTLCIGVSIGDEVHTTTVRLPGQRDQMRQMSVVTALDFLRLQLGAPRG